MDNEEEKIPDNNSGMRKLADKNEEDQISGKNLSIIQKEIELLKNSLQNLHKDNQLFLGILSASSLLDLLARSDSEKRDRLIADMSPFFSDFELHFQEMLLEKITNPMIFKLGETLLDELTVMFSKMGFYEKDKIKAEEKSSSFFSRKTTVEDRWDLIEDIEELLNRYDHLTHLKLPNFWKEVVLELHRYEYPENNEDRLFIETPSKIINEMINKLLKEAPCAQILQRYRRRKDSSGNYQQDIDQNSINSIKNNVKKYNERISDYITRINLEKDDKGLDSDLSAGFENKSPSQGKKLLKKTENCYTNFNLGTAYTEMRIPRTYQKIIRNTLDENIEMIDSSDNVSMEIIVNLLSVRLVYDLNNDIYKLKELLELMQEIKS